MKFHEEAYYNSFPADFYPKYSGSASIYNSLSSSLQKNGIRTE